MRRCSDTIRTRKRITAHSRALLFLGARLARVALACAFALLGRAGIARAYRQKKTHPFGWAVLEALLE
jgi:hypothetical protein